MNLFEQLKADMMTARWNSDKARAALLGTIIAEASRNDKNPSDDTVFATLKKFKASAEDMVKHLDNDATRAELYTICVYLPEPLTADELHAAVILSSTIQQIEISMKNMKAFKADLESQNPGRIDGQLLASVVKSFSQ